MFRFQKDFCFHFVSLKIAVSLQPVKESFMSWIVEPLVMVTQPLVLVQKWFAVFHHQHRDS